MADLFRIIIIGHNLQAKCDVANALIQQRNAFKQLSCRRHLQVRKFVTRDTIAGFKTVAVVTPNLNTPAWTHLKETIKKNCHHKVFLYINDVSKFQDNHKNTIEKIEMEFQSKDVFELKYSSADVSQGEYRFRPNAQFSIKIEDTRNVLTAIRSTIQSKQRQPFRGINYVPGRNVKNQKKNQTQDQKTEPVIDEDNEEDARIPIRLPERLTPIDWQNYTKTLKCGKAKSNLVRVNIVGNQNAGKTTLLKLLQDIKVKCPDEMQLQTEALDVRDTTTKCWESNGEKKWETDQLGYETELNIQRMAEAMRNATSIDTQDDGEVMDEDTSRLDEFMSEECEEDSTSPTIINIDKQKTLDLYLKKIIGRVNANATECVYVSYWDFAGQSTYYATHQAFLSHSAVYILVVDLSLEIKSRAADSLKFRCRDVHESSVAECITFWMSSIKAYTTDSKGGTSPIMVVGTHKDKLKPEQNRTLDEMIDEKFREIQNILGMTDVECIAIDNTKPDPDAIQAIRDRVLELGLGVVDELIPAQWIELERKVQEQKNNGKHILTFEDLKKLDEENDQPMRDDDRLIAFLAHQHCRGQLIHFPHENLKNIIILYPDDLSTFLNTLMRESKRGNKQGKGAYNNDGIINQRYINEAVNRLGIKEFQENRTYLTNMLIKLSIIHPFQSHLNENRYLLPCLLPLRNEGYDCESANIRSFKLEFLSYTMPSTFFYVLLPELLKRWKLLEPNLGEPEVFNLYACFYLDVETVHMEVYWSESYITFRIKNFSNTVKFANIGLAKIIDTISECISNIFRIYRHIETRHEIKAECPKHKGDFVDLRKLRQHGEAMCFRSGERHQVALNELMESEKCKEDIYPILEENISTLHLSRLALKLQKEDVTSLAARIRLFTGNVEADNVAKKTRDPNHRRFLILKKWKNQHYDASLRDLLELLTETGDYNRIDLIQLLEEVPSRNNYDISDQKLDNIPKYNEDIKAAMDCVGNSYPFLAFELGLSFEKVMEVGQNNEDLKMITYEVLQTWRQENPKTSFPRKLLDTAKYLDINTHLIQNALKNM